jgi:hypothetical protein
VISFQERERETLSIGSYTLSVVPADSGLYTSPCGHVKSEMLALDASWHRQRSNRRTLNAYENRIKKTHNRYMHRDDHPIRR